MSGRPDTFWSPAAGFNPPEKACDIVPLTAAETGFGEIGAQAALSHATFPPTRLPGSQGLHFYEWDFGPVRVAGPVVGVMAFFQLSQLPDDVASADELSARSLNEHDCLVLVDQDAVFQMPAHRPRKHDLLQVAAFAQHVLNRVAMGNTYNVLLDDWSIVQGSADVMAGSPDELHATVEGLMIGFRPDESGKKRMVDVDRAQQVLCDKFRTQDLHVARKHDQVHILPEYFKDFPLRLALVLGRPW